MASQHNILQRREYQEIGGEIQPPQSPVRTPTCLQSTLPANANTEPPNPTVVNHETCDAPRQHTNTVSAGTPGRGVPLMTKAFAYVSNENYEAIPGVLAEFASKSSGD